MKYLILFIFVYNKLVVRGRLVMLFLITEEERKNGRKQKVDQML